MKDTSTNDTNINICYELSKSSGTLEFWVEPGEDIYTDEDGEPIREAFE